MLLYVVIGIVALAAVVAVLAYLFAQSVRKPPDVYWIFQCPQCQQKLHYRPERAGRTGKCPRCKQYVRFPTTPLGTAPRRY